VCKAQWIVGDGEQGPGGKGGQETGEHGSGGGGSDGSDSIGVRSSSSSSMSIGAPFSHAFPSNPSKQLHTPLSSAHRPLPEHSCCAVWGVK
jgi:hypothetical protein